MNFQQSCKIRGEMSSTMCPLLEVKGLWQAFIGLNALTLKKKQVKTTIFHTKTKVDVSLID